MFITFKNCSTSENMLVSVDNRDYIIKPDESTDVLCQSENVIFEAKMATFDEWKTLIEELDKEAKGYSFKDKIFEKLSKKFAQKVSELMLDITVRYELNCNLNKNIVVNLYEGAYSTCDGKFAEIFDITPICYMFLRAESDFCEIKVLDAIASNRKKFLKLMRNILLSINWGIIFLDLFLFIPEYSLMKYYSSHFFVKKIFKILYSKTETERVAVLKEKEKNYEIEENGKGKGKGCIHSLLKWLVVILVLGGIWFWAVTSEPDVIISKDFSSVECFDETFVKIDSPIPSDAKDVFLEKYSAYYPIDDEGGYDMDNYYCYIFETPDGTRYMWLKDNCNEEENIDKDYEDYQNPLVYKSVGEN